MRRIGDKPNCCEKGDEYIWWDEFEILVSSFRGWRMIVGWDDKMEDEQGRIFRGISYCPFCGKKLDWAAEMLAEE